MRINKFVAQATGLSRRSADSVIREGRVKVNTVPAELGVTVNESDIITLDNRDLKLNKSTTTIILNKPVGCVCSRDGQGSKTIYDLLPSKYRALKTVGRLDKNSSGLLILTNDGDLIQQLSHPTHAKTKIYIVRLNKALSEETYKIVNDLGVKLEDGLSKMSLLKLDKTGFSWQISMQEGRKRQIRRTFAELGYNVKSLHRIQVEDYLLAGLETGQYRSV